MEDQKDCRNEGTTLLGCIPPNGFPAEHQRIRDQYHAVFQQRLCGVLRDVGSGFTKGAGFARVEQVESMKEWISAAEAIQLLRRIMNVYDAQKTVCARAHAGLIRAREGRATRPMRPETHLGVFCLSPQKPSIQTQATRVAARIEGTFLETATPPSCFTWA
jgi:hypothetical protein